MSAFGGTLYVHTHLVFVAVHASGVTFGDSGHFDCVSGKMKNTGRFSVRHSGRTAWKLGIITQKVSSSCEIILKLKPKCRYSLRVHGGAGPEGRRKPESETSESVSLCAAERHSDHSRRGRAEGMSGAPRRGRAGSQGADRETEILKNWKSEKLKSGPAKWARQDFRFSPRRLLPENLTG